MTDRGRQQDREFEKEVRREADRREIRGEIERREREQAETEEGSEAPNETVAEHPDGAQPDQSEGDELRLVTRGVLANSPWRLFLSLRTVIAASFATGAYALIFPTIWQLGDTFGLPRLVGLMVASIVALIFWMIVGHDLWERSTDEAELDPRVTPAMQNAVTLLTLTVAVLISYAVLFGFILLAALVFVSDSVIRSSLGHPVNFYDYLTLAWVATSISTITGALGSGLEDDEEVREAVNYR